MSDPKLPNDRPDDPNRPNDDPRYVHEEARELIDGLDAVSKDLSALAGFMRAAREMRTQNPDAATEAQHLAAIAKATAELREVTASSTKRSAAITVLRSRWTKGGAIAVAAVLATGSLAAAKVLPAAAQNAVAAVAEVVGIHLPRADDEQEDDEARLDPALDDADLDGDGVPASEDPDDVRLLNESASDLDGDGVPAARDPDDAKQIAEDSKDNSGKSTGRDPAADPGPPDDKPAGPPSDKPAGPPDDRGNVPDDPGRPDEDPAQPRRPADPPPPRDDNDAGRPEDPGNDRSMRDAERQQDTDPDPPQDNDPGRPEDPGNNGGDKGKPNSD